MSPKQVIDLTMTLDPTRSDWARDNQWGVLEREKRIIIDPWIFPDRCLVEDITLYTHLGTHINSPYHQYGLIDGKQLEDFPLESFIGEAVILDMTFVGIAKEPGKKRIIKSSDLVRFEGKIKEGDIVLFFTNFKPPNTPIIGDDAARWFIEKRIKLAGTQDETIRFGTMGKMTFLGNNIPLIEGLVNLEKLKKERVFIIALPLPIRGIGASPARVMAIEE